jgi:hypothetical protein
VPRVTTGGVLHRDSDKLREAEAERERTIRRNKAAAHRAAELKSLKIQLKW